MPISADEKVKDVVWYADNTLLIHCETTASPPYFFTICLDNSASPFTTLYFLRSLNGSVYEPLMKELETEIDNKAWQSKDGQPLRARLVAGKVRRLLQLIATMTAANKAVASAIMPLTLSRGRNTQGASEGSARNVLNQRLAATGAKPSTNRRNSKRPNNAITSTPSASQRKRANVQGLPEASTASTITQVPSELELGQEFDYAEIANIYNKFWTECQSCFVFGVEAKHEVHIDQLERAPEDWTVRAYEEHGMQKLRHFLINMPDRTTRQTLCIMPQTQEKPTSFHDIEDGNFWIINGQHSVEASKTMQGMDVPQSTREFFQKWNCFIVWTRSKEKLRKISAYYNRVNHFSSFKPTWSTNILAARFIWTELGSPVPPKTATALGTVVRQGRKDLENDGKYKVISVPSRPS